MLKKGQKIFYIDASDAIVREGRFAGYDDRDTGGAWLRLQGQSVNLFVYPENIDRLVYLSLTDAEAGLEAMREEMRQLLQQNNKYIDDVCSRLSKYESRLYIEIIRQILEERTN